MKTTTRLHRDTFRIILVEDEEPVQRDYQATLGEHFQVEPVPARTQGDAIELLRERFFDAAIVDIELDVPAAGYDVLRALGKFAPSTPVVVATQHSSAFPSLFEFGADEGPRIVGVIDKGEAPDGWLENFVAAQLKEWGGRAVSLVGLPEVSQRVLETVGAASDEVRRDVGELAVEVDRLVRELFGKARPLGEATAVEVALVPIETQTKDAALTVAADIVLGHDDNSQAVHGNNCVMRIGARRAIAEEARRFEQHVKFGVPLAERVELLGSAEGDGLGAVCYGLGVGRIEGPVVLLESLLKADHGAAVLAVIDRMFDSNTARWSPVRTRDIALSQWYKRTHGYRLRDGYTAMDQILQRLDERFGSVRYSRASQKADGALEVAGTRLPVPTPGLLGGTGFSAGIPSCLAHGHLNAGNVVIEWAVDGAPRVDGAPWDSDLMSERLSRVYLLDYSCAGPAPRCVDAVAVDAVLRAADAEAIAASVEEGSETGWDLSEAGTEVALRLAVERATGEQLLASRLWRLHRSPEEADAQHFGLSWQEAPALLVQRMQENFPDLDAREYLAAGIACGLRSLEDELSPVSAMRMISWLLSQYAIWSSLPFG